MSTLRISDAPLLPDVNGTEKIPTGGRGDYAVSIDQIKNFAHIQKLTYNNFSEIDGLYSNSNQNFTANYMIDSRDEVLAQLYGGLGAPIENAVLAPIPTITTFILTNAQIYNNCLESWKPLSSSSFIVPINNIPTSSITNSVSGRLFRAYEYWNQSLSKFKCVANEPLMVRLQGSISLLVKVSDKSKESLRLEGKLPIEAPIAWLELVSDEKPTISRYTRTGVSSYVHATSVDMKKISNNSLLQPQVKPYEYFTQEILDTIEKKDITYDVSGKYIRKLDISEDLPLGNSNNKTTGWFDIGDERMIHSKAIGGTSTTSRIQYKDKYGKIFFGYNQGFDNVSANKIYVIPEDMVQARIWFRGANDTATDLEVRAIPKEHDAFYGQWVEYTFNIDQSVVFAPESIYSYVLRFYNVTEDCALDTNGFFIKSGSISFLSNGREFVQETYNKLLGEG